MRSLSGTVRKVDGHHRLAALQLLGATTAQVYNLPST